MVGWIRLWAVIAINKKAMNLKDSRQIFMKVLILGIGNILFGDEGIGVHLSNYLKVNYAFKSSAHSLQIIDNAKIGDVFAFDFNAVPINVNWQGTAHEVEMLQTLKMIEMLGDLPTIKIVATIPHILDSDTTFELSQTIKKSAMTMRDEVFAHLKNLGFEIEKIADRDLQDIANLSYKGF